MMANQNDLKTAKDLGNLEARMENLEKAFDDFRKHAEKQFQWNRKHFKCLEDKLDEFMDQRQKKQDWKTIVPWVLSGMVLASAGLNIQDIIEIIKKVLL